MSITLRVELSDPDLEQLLIYLDGLRHLNRGAKEDLLIRCREWLNRSDKFTYNALPSPQVSLTIDGNPLFAASNTCNVPQQSAGTVHPERETVQVSS